jgi:glycosyltransferase involved in cell wall biosynthesis
LKDAPLVLWVQDIWPEALQATGFVRNRLMLRMVAHLMHYIYRHCDSILIQSEGFRDSVERLVDDPHKIRFFPNSAEAMSMQPSPSQSPDDIAERIAGHFSVVFAGNIGTVQSCETIVAAAGLLQAYPEIRFYLVGSGSMAEAIAKTIASQGLNNVVMTGRVPGDQIPNIYAAASVLLLSFQPDSALSATIPSKLQGYLAAGKPIIVSSDGEPANVLRRADAGLTCAPGDPQAVAEAVLALHEMTPEERAGLGENGRNYFLANFHLSDRVSELTAHIKDLVERHGLMGTPR